MCRYDGFAISIQIFKKNLSYAEVGWIMVALDGVHVGFPGGKLSDKIGFTKSWFSVCSPAEYYCFSYIHPYFGIVCRNVYHNDRGGYVSSRHVCLPLPIQNRESHQVMTLVRLAVNLGLQQDRL
jgi:hypothetical protein